MIAPSGISDAVKLAIRPAWLEEPLAVFLKVPFAPGHDLVGPAGNHVNFDQSVTSQAGNTDTGSRR
jgi:hypothetical protein